MLAKLAGYLIAITLLTSLFLLIPFEIALPQEVVNFIATGPIQKIVDITYYFFPIDYLIICISVLFLAKYSGIIFRIITWIYNKVVN